MATDAPTGPAPSAGPTNFIEQIIEADSASAKWGCWPGTATPRVHTRFPPEPNGFLHIGHAKSICLNYGLAKKYGGKFNLRFDDTNPAKEELQYVEGIKRDVRWITAGLEGGRPHSFDQGPHAGGMFWASDYFQQMYDFAVALIRAGHAYVCELTADEVSARRGSTSVPATSPFRDRPGNESLRLFDEMRRGVHPDGKMTLRARIDLASPNFNLRDPVLYRIMHAHHHNTGDRWCIYPMYDWAHGIEDSLENITHSICTLEFENHRPLYDWFIRAVGQAVGGQHPPGAASTELGGSGPATSPRALWHSQQIEFAKLLFTHTVLSKRNLLKMVTDGVVKGWDDPRMPTIVGLRRRGFPASAIADLCAEVGVTKFDSVIDLSRLENAARSTLNRTAPRAMCVLDPLRVTVTNWPAGKVDLLDFVINPEDPGAGTRQVPFTGELFIEREDFMEAPTKGFFRLAPGQEVRLRWAYLLTCTGVTKDSAGNIASVQCTYDPATRGGDVPPNPDGTPGRKVKATLHWISAAHARTGEVRLVDRLFNHPAPGERTGNWADDLNPDSLRVVTGAMLDPAVVDAAPGQAFQFERLGYFAADPDTRPGAPVFNRTITLKDSAKDTGEAKPKAPVRNYTLPEAAHDLKIKQGVLLEVARAAGIGEPAAISARQPAHLTLDEVRAMKAWLKANPAPKA
jgi:glutaminyl-tRNA synthetase